MCLCNLPGIRCCISLRDIMKQNMMHTRPTLVQTEIRKLNNWQLACPRNKIIIFTGSLWPPTFIMFLHLAPLKKVWTPLAYRNVTLIFDCNNVNHYIIITSSASDCLTPCANGGTCIHGNCICPSNYDGTFCQNISEYITLLYVPIIGAIVLIRQ